MIFRELNRVKCKTYLVACEETRKALLIDPVRDFLDRYFGVLAYFGLTLDGVVDTHTHADHRTASFALHDLTGAPVIMHRRAPAPHVARHVEHGERIEVGRLALEILYTPGHTPDGISVYAGDRVFTGDTLLIKGTGRSDFAGGYLGAQYDGITEKLFRLPDETLVFPAHDYRGNTSSTIGEEKRSNPRVAGRSREAYVDLMNNLGLPLPEKIQEALQANQSAIEDESLQFMITHHQTRRGWNDFVRISLALSRKSSLQQAGLNNMRLGGKYKGLANLPEAKHIDVRQEIAYLAGACPRNVSKVKTILEKGHLRLIEACQDGVVTVHRALQFCRLPQAQQVEAFSRYLNKRSSDKTARHSIAKLRLERIRPTTGDLLHALQQLESREPGSIEIRASTRKKTIILLGEDNWNDVSALAEMGTA